MKLEPNTWLASSRRRFMATSGIAVAGSMTVGVGLTSCGGPATVEGAPFQFSTDQYELLGTLSDMLIPPTDTPGATGAGVPAWVQQMMNDWAKSETRDQIVAALKLLDEKAIEAHGKGFAALDDEKKASVLEPFEKLCFSKDSGDGSKDSGDGVELSEAEAELQTAKQGYRALKKLIHRGYYWSEVGATQELHYELQPGPDARADAPLSEVGRTWIYR